MRMPALVRRRWYGAGLLALALLVAGAVFVYGRAAAPAPVPELDDYCVVAPPTPHDPGSGLGLLQARPVPADARCPVCGMFPARAPEWAAQALFANGDTQFFDSPLTLFLYLHDVGRYTPGRQAGEVAISYVSDSVSGQWMPAAEAFYVHGSNALGPMRMGNLPAFASASAARHFASTRGGTVLRAAQITPDVLQGLMAPRRHAHTAQVP